jgi:transposase
LDPELAPLRYHVRLLPVQYVQPYVRRNKTDRTDTDALLEAARCEGIQPVAVTTPEQQAPQALHRVRTQWQETRTARLNTLRGMLREHGIPIPETEPNTETLANLSLQPTAHVGLPRGPRSERAAAHHRPHFHAVYQDSTAVAGLGALAIRQATTQDRAIAVRDDTMGHAIHRVEHFEIVDPYTLALKFDDGSQQRIAP